jgi:hypothetical protein
MSKKTYRYIDGELVLVRDTARKEPVSAYVIGDLPGYDSPIDGKWVEGRKARREDLKRTGCRPWEGLEQEKKEAARIRAEQDRKTDQMAEKIAHRLWAEAPESVRKLFRYK